jgi:hypothetical protein
VTGYGAHSSESAAAVSEYVRIVRLSCALASSFPAVPAMEATDIRSHDPRDIRRSLSGPCIVSTERRAPMAGSGGCAGLISAAQVTSWFRARVVF